MRTVLFLIPVMLTAAFVMYLQYRSLSEARRQRTVWKAMCIAPALAVGVFLIWIALRS